MEPLFVAIAAILKSWMRLMGWRMHVTGQEQLPASGPAILASNHVGYLDPVQIGWVVQRWGRKTPRFLTKLELFRHPLLGPILRNLKQVPVDRGANPAAALPVAEERVRAGDWVVVFPEGTISTSFVPAEPRAGAARLAVATGAPLIPVALWGSHRLLTKYRPRNLQRNVVWSVRIGSPLPYEPGEDPVAVAKRLWDEVRALVDAAQREYPQQPAGPQDRWWLPRHLGGSAPSVEESNQQRREERQRWEERCGREQRAPGTGPPGGGRGRDPGEQGRP